MHTALYRKYRPVGFNDVIGQSHIVTTLKNQISGGKVSHAYLFCGTRGTGKTSVAKIFAKAVNCTNPIDSSPCGKCKTCLALDNANNVDVLEIDAASNNKVDEVREIRENSRFLPVNGKYKVYIIDEVHMLTDSAFNALLKTLEEPPAHVIFILATTEVHKLPATILSRCMRFDFRLVGNSELEKLLTKIYDAEKITASADAIKHIALCGEGSVRDMLSVADLCASYKTDLAFDDILTVLGTPNRADTFSLLKAINSASISDIFISINELSSKGKSMALVAKDTIKLERDLALVKTAVNAQDILAVSNELLQQLKDASNDYSIEFLLSVIGTLSGIDAELRYSMSPKITLECACLSLASRIKYDINSLVDRINRLEANGVSVVKTEQPPLKAEENSSVLGRIATELRTSGNMTAYNFVSTHKDVIVLSDKIIFNCDNATYSEITANENIVFSIQKAIKNLNLQIEVQLKQTEKADIDSEISKLKKLLGKTPITIKN